jgi:hypothetical protein
MPTNKQSLRCGDSWVAISTAAYSTTPICIRPPLSVFDIVKMTDYLPYLHSRDGFRRQFAYYFHKLRRVEYRGRMLLLLY